jgi:hypothetical protein
MLTSLEYWTARFRQAMTVSINATRRRQRQCVGRRVPTHQELRLVTMAAGIAVAMPPRQKTVQVA